MGWLGCVAWSAVRRNIMRKLFLHANWSLLRLGHERHRVERIDPADGKPFGKVDLCGSVAVGRRLLFH